MDRMNNEKQTNQIICSISEKTSPFRERFDILKIKNKNKEEIKTEYTMEKFLVLMNSWKNLIKEIETTVNLIFDKIEKKQEEKIFFTKETEGKINVLLDGLDDLNNEILIIMSKRLDENISEENLKELIDFLVSLINTYNLDTWEEYQQLIGEYYEQEK